MKLGYIREYVTLAETLSFSKAAEIILIKNEIQHY